MQLHNSLIRTLLQQRQSRHSKQQNCDKYGANDGEVGPSLMDDGGGAQHEDAPPKEQLAKVIGMPRIIPQSISAPRRLIRRILPDLSQKK